MKITSFIRSIIEAIIPRNRGGDCVFSIIWFVWANGRLPRSPTLGSKRNRNGRRRSAVSHFNDYLLMRKIGRSATDPLLQFTTDKINVKTYVAAKIGAQYCVPTTAVLRSYEEICAYSFPRDCCIKATHLSGATIIRRNGSPLDLGVLKQWLLMNHYRIGREFNYRYLLPGVIVEPLLFDGGDVRDYKFFCYRGIPRLLQVDSDRFLEHRRTIFDLNGGVLDFGLKFRTAISVLLPENFKEMGEKCKSIAEEFEFVRVDWYSNGKLCYVGELTHFPGNAEEQIIPSEKGILFDQLVFGQVV